MWLLNTQTLKLEAFLGTVPSYAILSHRWENGELSFGDVTPAHHHLKGCRKVKAFCEEARRNQFDYVWVDTCCIDKKSSAELGEATNSMYMWYKQADICYAYLCDVEATDDIAQSSWFTRGWTLQELLAPTKLLFYDRNWSRMASKHDLAAKLMDITGVPQEAIHAFRHHHFCVAEKMAWAAQRTTTRPEDSAYCLLGLFDVNMPLLYGEGSKAFTRLQEEIMKASTDLSILLWNGSASPTNGILAAAPSCFAQDDHSLSGWPREDTIFYVYRGWTANNAGISVRLTVHPYLISQNADRIFFVLVHEPLRNLEVGMFLEKLNGSAARSKPSYRRVTVDGRAWLEHHISQSDHEGVKRQLFITRDAPINYTINDSIREMRIQISLSSVARCTVSSGSFAGSHRCALKDWPMLSATVTRYVNQSFHTQPLRAVGFFGQIVIKLAYGEDILVCFGFDYDFRAICLVLPLCETLYAQGLDAHSLYMRYSRLCGESKGGGGYHDEVDELFALVSEDVFIYSGLDLDDIGIFLWFDNTFADAKLQLDSDKFLQHYFHGHADTDLPARETAAGKSPLTVHHKFLHSRERWGELGPSGI